MIKSIKAIMRQDKERYTIPRRVQDVIPIQAIWPDGIFKVGNKFSKTFRFSDINYMVASREDKEAMFLTYSELLNSLDSAATTKLTICNHCQNRANFEQSILMSMRGDGLDEYRREYNQMLIDKATGANGIMQEKFVTVSIYKKDIEDARAYFARIGADLTARFAALDSQCVELEAVDRLRILHGFYRAGEEETFRFDMADMARLGHDFKDYICPDAMEKHSDYLKLGDRYCRVLFLKDYASYIKDDMVTELTDLNRNMMLSIDILSVPTDEAVREVENRLLGVETNITNWQRRQNQNNNFSAIVPYDMELQRKESKEFLDDLTTRDQRMMVAVLTMVITADSKQQLDADTDSIRRLTGQRMCQMAVLKYQQLYGIGTGDGEIVTVALSQIGNVGGQPYWSWYGFNTRVDWCAIFVSWCANECGYLDAGVIPKFAGCITGSQWFKDRGLWQDRNYEPCPGDLVFFDWDDPGGFSGPQDGLCDHVGIVEKAENGVVYTVEGNSGDVCREAHYPVGHYEIYGYGTPAY